MKLQNKTACPIPQGQQLLRKMSLLVCLSLTFLLLTGCNQMDYSKAVKEYNEGHYTSAVKLFEELGDYKDSKDYLEKSNLGIFCEYLKQRGSVDIASNSTLEYTVTIALQGNDTLLLDYSLSPTSAYLGFDVSMHISYPIMSDSADVSASAHMYVYSDSSSETASGTYRVDQPFSAFKWDNYNISPVGFSGLINDNSNSTLPGRFEEIFDALNQVIDDSGADITLSDLGFVNAF